MALPYLLLAGLSIQRNRNIYSKRLIKIPTDIRNGITFTEELIIVKQDQSLMIFSSRCSHLGCRINAVDNDEIICPCHGSRFNLEGKSVKGPASNPLKQLKYTFDEINNEYIVEL
jgi:Rieske Fe-S protein